MKLIWEINLAREQLLVQLKMEADKNNSEREKMQAELNQKREQALLKTKAEADEATKKREQMFMEHELKRQKLLIDANSSIQKIPTGKLQIWRHLSVVSLSFNSCNKKKQKLRELASQKLKVRVSLERELAKQQQQNLLSRKQSEIDKLQSESDKRLFEQKLAEKEKEKGMPPALTVTYLSQLLLNHLVRIHRRLLRIGLGYFINSLLLLHSLLCRRFHLLKC